MINAKKITDNKVFLACISFILAMLILTLMLLVMGYSPVESYKALFYGAFGSWENIATTLGTATPLILAGLSMSVASKSGTFNIGCEGQIIAGAFAAALAGIYCSGLPKVLHILVCFLAAILVGGLCGALIALLKRILNVSELIIAIMLNYIIEYVTDYLLTYHFTIEGMVVRTEYIAETAELKQLALLSRLNTGFFVMIALVILSVILLRKSILGYEMRACGYNSYAAETAGINLKTMSYAGMFISGAIAAIGGAIEVMGVHRYFISNMTAGYGFTGVAVGIMGGSTPIGTFISGLIFGALRAGSTNMNRATTVPSEFMSVLQALVIVFIATPRITKSLLSVKRSKSKKGGAE